MSCGRVVERAGVCAADSPGAWVSGRDSCGGGYRSGMAAIGATAGEVIYLENVSSAPLAAGGRGTIEVYPLHFEQ